MKQRRIACGLQTVHELEAMYPQFTEELVWEKAAESGVIYKSGIMQVQGELGLRAGSNYGETYHKLFGWNPRGIVLHSPEYLPVREVLATAKASGGAVVFAHPTVYKSLPLVRELAAEGRLQRVHGGALPGGPRGVRAALPGIRPCAHGRDGFPWPEPQGAPSHRHLYRSGRDGHPPAGDRPQTGRRQWYTIKPEKAFPL